MTLQDQHSNRIFTESLTLEDIHFVKTNVPREDLIGWLKENFDYVTGYHASRPHDVGSYYTNGFLPSNFTKADNDFKNMLSDVSYDGSYDPKPIFNEFQDDSNKKIYFSMNKEDFLDSDTHYLIYGSELIFNLAQDTHHSIKYHLNKIGIPTIFYCNIPIEDIDYKDLFDLYDRIVKSEGNLTERLYYITQNYTITIDDYLSGKTIVKHIHPTTKLFDYHTNRYYKNSQEFCSICIPNL
ncbi:hypothetical protein [Dyadobacter alkalitolerans]|uniref:hypothetical protein n=1 Tax=Dyadobacter alkalitolerans TaxID=492736 RepID=UPI00042A02E8|nr:hypothetical protein [Dyadobacter alkalitolerans]